jgi:hypothetical protein
MILQVGVATEREKRKKGRKKKAYSVLYCSSIISFMFKVSSEDFYLSCYLLHAGFFLSLFFDPEDGCDMFLRKRRLTFNGLNGVALYPRS